MPLFKKRLLPTIYIAFVVVSISSVAILSFLGKKERIGYLEIGNRDEFKSSYSVRVRYYDKVFRNSDIYSVHIKTASLPDSIKSVKWDVDGSPFGYILSEEELNLPSKIDNIPYILKVKKLLCVYLLFLIIATPILYIAFSKSNMKVFKGTGEIIDSVNKINSKKNIYYILGLAGILLIFGLLWYTKGYYSYFSMIDSVIESNGSVINFKFPENLFEKTSHSVSTSYWYKSRWSGTAFIFLSSQIISPLYTMITGDVIKSIFVSQGFMVSFIFVATGFMLALYIAKIFGVKILSKHFLLFLFFTQAMQIAIYTIAATNTKLNYFIGLLNGGSPIANYNGSLLILLIALFPYWRYFITGKWDDWFDKKWLVAIYHLIIILAAFSSPAIYAFYGLVSGFIFISILAKEKSIPAINHKIGSTLYASMFWTTVAMVSESKYVTGMVGGELTDKLKGFQTSLLIILAYTLVFVILTVLPTIAIYKSQKAKVDNNKLIKRIFISLVLCYVGMLSYLLLASIKNDRTLEQLFKGGYGTAFNSAYICVANIFLVLAITISFTSIFMYLRLSFIKGFALMFLISHCVFYIGRHGGENRYMEAYSFFRTLHEANKNKDINSNIIYLDKETYNRYLVQWANSDFHIRITENFARQFNIIDKDAVIMEKVE